jgi:hypothetical protein
MSNLIYPYGFIYETTNTVNGMKYIGSHKREQNSGDPDDSWYLGSPTNPQFWDDLEEYGRSSFVRRIIEDVYEEDKRVLKQRESYYLKEVDAMHNPSYYNKSNSAEYGGGATEGMKIMHKGELNQFFSPEDVHQAIIDGWILGRTENQIESNCMKNPQVVQRLFDENPHIVQQLNNARACHNPMESEESRRKVAKSKEGKIWVNNGVEMTYIDPEYLEIYKSFGYVKGMIRTKHLVSKDYDCVCKICGRSYKGGKYSTVCKPCYSEMKRQEGINRYKEDYYDERK